jgi:hypothetical protein
MSGLAAVHDFGAPYRRSGLFASKAVEALHPCTSAAATKADVNSPPWFPPLSATSRPEQVQQTEQALLDHLIGEREQRWRHVQAERLSGFKIDYQFELRRLFYR